MMKTTNHVRRATTPRAGACAAITVCALVFSGCASFPAGLGGPSSDARTSDAKGARASSAKTTSPSGVYSVTFGVRSGAGKLGAVQFDVRPRAAGQWQGSGAKVACTSLIGSAMTACNEKSGGLLSCGLINPNGFAVPADIVRCVFQSKSPVAPSDFSVKVVDSSDTAAKPVGAYVLVTSVAAR
jgi:hypothetical protein